MPIIRAKLRHPQAIGYNSWSVIEFPATTNLNNIVANTVIQRSFLAVNCKIIAVTAYVFGATTSGQTSFNLVSGAGAYETTGKANVTISVNGTPQSGDTITFTVNGVPSTVTANSSSTTTSLAVAMAAAINTNSGTIVQAGTNGGSTVLVQAVTPGTVGNAITISASASPGGSGHATFNTGQTTLTGGSAYVAPVTPVNDTTYTGPTPPTTVQPGQAMFATDQVFNWTNETGQVFYPATYDAIWPASSSVSLRITGGTGSGNFRLSFWFVPVDINSFTPEVHNMYFVPGPTTL